MRNIGLLFTLVLSFLLATCGGDSGGGGGGSKKSAPTVSDPWSGVGRASLPAGEDVLTESIRVLEFGDGMGISYDGSDQGGAEEVCRREQVNEAWYEVCMPLEDDPDFVVLESQAFVWHPLLFDRFATELICRTWTEGQDKIEPGCEQVFPVMGGSEDFRCEAGLVNGDKGLKCSDGWSVVVNGDTDDIKTICRVHTENGSGRCLAAPKGDVANEELILEMQQSSWEGYRSGQDNERQFAMGEVVAAVTPQDLPSGAELIYYSRDEEICTVDNDDSDQGVGGVTIREGLNPPTTCKIVLKIEASGYADRILFAELPILKDNDTEWETPGFDSNSGRHYRDRIFSPGTVTASDPATPKLEYSSADESICTIDRNGAINGVGAGECRVTLTATAEDYLDRVIEKSATLLELNQFSDIIWGFPTSATVGVDTAALDAPVGKDADGNDAGLILAITAESGDCAYDSTTRVVSFSGTTECVMSVDVGTNGYIPYTKEFRVTPTEGNMQLAWTGYANSNVASFGATPPELVPPVTNPTSLGASYAYSAAGSGCEVDADSGAVTLLGADKTGRSCEVTLTATLDGYAESSIGHTVTVNKGSQTMSAPFLYGQATTVRYGSSLDVVNPPTGGHGDVVYTKHSGTCTVDSSTGRMTITALGNRCEVKVKWAGDENYNPSNEVTTGITSVLNDNDATPTWSGTPYGSTNPAVGGSAVSLVAGAISNTGSGSAEYQSGTPVICSVNNANGELTGVSAGTCTVQARFRGDSSKGASGWVDSPDITVDKGTHPAPAANPYGSGVRIKVGDSLALVTPPTGHGTATYSTLQPGFCRVDANTGEVTGLQITANCTIQVAFDGDANYNALAATDLQSIAVDAGIQSLSFSEPYGTDPALVVGEELAIVTAPTSMAGSGSGGGLSYRVQGGSTAYCRVHSSDGTVTGLEAGDCIIEVQSTSILNWNFSPWTEIATIAVSEATLTGISWTPGDSVSAVGEDLTLAAVNVGDSGATVRYEVTDAGESGCAFKAADQNDATAERTLTFGDRGTCVVTAIGEKSGYTAWEQEHTVEVDLGILEIEDDVWGRFAYGDLVVGGSTLAINRIGNIPDGVSITYSLLRGERDCRLVNYRTGEVAALPVRLDREAFPAWLPLYKEVDVPAVRFTAKAVGTVGNDITVKIENGGTDGKKYTIVDGTNPDEVYDNMMLEDLETAMSGSLIVDVTVLDLTDEPVNVTATNLAGGTASDKASGNFTRRGEVEVARLSAKAVGPTGNAITVTIQDGTNNDKKYTISDGTNPEEVYDDVAIDGLEAAMSASVLVDVAVSDPASSHEPDNITTATNLLPGGEAINNKCSIVGTAHKRGYYRVKSDPIEVRLFPGDILLSSLPRYENMRINPDQTVQLPPSGSLELEPDGQPRTVGGYELEVDYSTGRGYTSGTTDFTDTNAYKDDVCVVDAATGTITVGSAAVAGDICRLTIRFTDPSGARNDLETSWNFVVAGGTLVFGTTPTLSYGNSALLKVGDSTPLTPGGLSSPDDNSVDVVWNYVLTGTSSDGQSAKENVCQVDWRLKVGHPLADNPNYGNITLGDGADMGDTCTIKAYATAPGYNWYEDVSAVSFVVEGKDLLFTGNGTKPAYPGQLRLSGTAAPDTLTTTDDNSVDVTWSGWEVTGRDGTDTGDPKAEKVDVCSIDTATGVVSLESAAVAGDICEVYATAAATTAENYKTSKIRLANYTIVATGTFTVTPPVYDADGLLVEGDALAVTTVAGATPGTVNGESVTWVYSAVGKRAGTATDDICTIDAANGTVTPGSATQIGDTCEITATVNANGYTAASTTVVTLTVKEVFDSLAWSTFPASATVGVDIDLASNQPASDPAADSYTIAVDSGDCAYSGTTLSFTNTTECVVSATAVKAGYVSKSATFRVTPALGTLPAITWGSFSGSLQVGGNAKFPRSPILPSGIALSIHYALKQGSAINCDLTNAGIGQVRAKAVDLSGSPVCTVIGTISARGYTPVTSGDISIPLSAGEQSITWGSFNGNLVVGGEAVAPTAATGTSGATVSYIFKEGSETNCEFVNGNTGQMRAKAVDLTGGTVTCTIVGVATRTGYTTETEEISIDLAPGTITVADWGSYDRVNTGSATVAPDLGTITPTAATKAYDSADTAACTVDTNSGAVTGVAVGDDNCDIELTLSATGYTDLTHTYTLSVTLPPIVVAGADDAAKWGTYSVTVGSAASSAPAIGTTTPATVTKAYTLAPGSIGCTVDSAGAVTATDAGGDKRCRIQLTLSADGYDNTVHTYVISATAGTIAATATANYGTVVVGAATAAPAVTGLAPADAIKRYSTSSAGCTVDANSGAVTGVATGTGNCEIVLTLSAAGYDDKTHTYTAFNVAEGTQTGLYWNPGATTVATSDGTLTLNAVTLGGGSAGVAYSVPNAGTTNCSVVSATRVLTFSAAGTCTVRATVTRTGYTAWMEDVDIVVTDAMPVSITGFGYSGTATFGGTAPTLDTVTLDPTDATVGYTSETTGVCTVDSGTGALTLVSAGTCVVVLTATHSDTSTYAANTAQVAIAVGKATQPRTPSASNIYGASPTLVTGESLSVVTPPAPTSSSQGSVGYRSATPTICRVNSHTGRVTALDDGSCTVAARWTGDANNAPSVHNNMQTITVGEGTLFLYTNAFPAYESETLGTRGSVAIGALPGNDDNGVSVSWSFTAAGTRSGTAQSDVCSVDSDSGTVSSGSAAQVDDICTVTATASATGYVDVSRDYTLTLIQASNYPVQIATGLHHSCVRFSEGGVKCWGYGDSGRLGLGDTQDRGDGPNEMGSNLPWVDLGEGRTARSVSVGAHHSCAILDDGSLKCWGWNGKGQLGIGNTTSASTPQPVNLGQGRTATQMVLGYHWTCALLDDNTVKCWGANGSGMLGYGDGTQRNRPPATATVNFGQGRYATKLAAGYWHACALLDNGGIKCWGGNNNGQLGGGITGVRSSPHSVFDSGGRDVFAGVYHTCVITEQTGFQCFGGNHGVQLGRGGGGSNYHNVVQNVALPDGRSIQQLALGSTHSCALLDDDSLACWGKAGGNDAYNINGSNNSVFGQLGYGDTANRDAPPATDRVDLGTGRTAVQISAGVGFTCAILDDHTVKCWGSGDKGKLGSGSATTKWGDGPNEMGDNLPVVELL